MDGATLTNHGVIDLADGFSSPVGGFSLAFSNNGRVVNQGTVRKSTGTGQSWLSLFSAGSFDNFGTVSVASGTLVVGVPSSAGQADTGTYTTAAGTTLQLGGTRRFASTATFAGAGHLDLSNASLSGGASGTVGSISIEGYFGVELAGTTAGVDYPQLQATGALSIAPDSFPTLTVSVAPGYCPNPTDTYAILGYASRSGGFLGVTSQPGGRTFDISYGASSATVDVAGGICDVTPPTVTGLQLQDVKPTDELLHRDLQVTATDNPGGSGVNRVEYRWSSSTTKPVHQLDNTSIVSIDFSDTTPSSSWTLQVRAVDNFGLTSAWQTAWTGTTPKPPLVVAIGDSVTSGHHKDSSTSGTSCHDAGYGYPHYYVERVRDLLPAAWAPTYLNYAESGATTFEMLGSGIDACGLPFSGMMANARSRLNTNAGSWNRVLITGGVDDTNWASPLGPLVSMILDPLARVPGIGPTACSNHLALVWDGPSKLPGVTTNVRTIVQGLHSSAGDSGARLIWLSYYNFAGTGPLSSQCSGAISSGNESMSAAVRDGIAAVDPIGAYASFLDISSAIAQSGIQEWFWTDFATLGVHAGWPHPNSSGAAAIAQRIPL